MGAAIIIVVIILLFLIIGGGAYFFMNKTSTSSPPPSSPPKTSQPPSSSPPPSSQPCSGYKDSDVNISDACIKDIWFNVAKCPNNSLDTVPYYISNKATMTKAQITNDAKAWASLPDDNHRKACYGDDKTKWPISGSPSAYIRYYMKNNYLHY